MLKITGLFAGRSPLAFSICGRLSLENRLSEPQKRGKSEGDRMWLSRREGKLKL